LKSRSTKAINLERFLDLKEGFELFIENVLFADKNV
jgi:hypothetical protein